MTLVSKRSNDEGVKLLYPWCLIEGILIIQMQSSVIFYLGAVEIVF